MKWIITSLLREGVKGTEEEVVGNALKQLGYNEIKSCKMGKLVILTLKDDQPEDVQREKVVEMCKKQIINTILYDFKVEPYNVETV